MYIVPTTEDFDEIFQNIKLYDEASGRCMSQCTGCKCDCQCACRVTSELLNW